MTMTVAMLLAFHSGVLAAVDPGTIIAALIGLIGTLLLGFMQFSNNTRVGHRRDAASKLAADNAKMLDTAARKAGVTDDLRAVISLQHEQYVTLVNDTADQLALSSATLAQCEKDRHSQDEVIAYLRQSIDVLRSELAAVKTTIVTKLHIPVDPA